MDCEITESFRKDQACQKTMLGAIISNSPGTGSRRGMRVSTDKLLDVLKILVRLSGLTSNQLFKILEEWNQILQGISVDLSPEHQKNTCNTYGFTVRYK